MPLTSVLHPRLLLHHMVLAEGSVDVARPETDDVQGKLEVGVGTRQLSCAVDIADRASSLWTGVSHTPEAPPV